MFDLGTLLNSPQWKLLFKIVTLYSFLLKYSFFLAINMLADLHMTSKDYKLAFEVNMALAYKTENHFQTQHTYNRNVINILLISSSVQ